MLSSQALNALDTSPYLGFISNRKSFIMKPGEVQLNIPGAFDPTTHTGSLRNQRGERPSFIGALKNSFNSSKYAPIQNYETLESQANPLLWDEDDEDSSQIKNVVK